jgi:coenzyme Q-binding protein COQ10
MREMILPGYARQGPLTPDTDELPKFTLKRHVNFTPQQIHAVVADVASYKEFLPLVERSTVRNRKPKKGTIENFGADLVIGYKKLKIQESFSSLVESDVENLTVKASSSGNAVKKLVSSWQIVQAGDNTSDVTFAVDYELKSSMLQMLLGRMVGSLAEKIMTAFETRAGKLYNT